MVHRKVLPVEWQSGPPQGLGVFAGAARAALSPCSSLGLSFPCFASSFAAALGICETYTCTSGYVAKGNETTCPFSPCHLEECCYIPGIISFMQSQTECGERTSPCNIWQSWIKQIKQVFPPLPCRGGGWGVEGLGRCSELFYGSMNTARIFMWECLFLGSGVARVYLPSPFLCEILENQTRNFSVPIETPHLGASYTEPEALQG